MVATPDDDQQYADHGANDRREQDDHGQGLPAHPGTNGGQQFEITVTHAFLAGNQFEQMVYRPQGQVAGYCTDNAGMTVDKDIKQTEKQATPEQWQGNRVRQNLVIEINQEQGYQRSGKQQGHDGLQAVAEMQGGDHRQDSSDRLHDRVAW